MRLHLGLGWKEAKLKAMLKGWKVSVEKNGLIQIDTGHSKLDLTKRKAMIMINQWDEWVKHYLPPFSLKGLDLLSVGAGCGETTDLYFLMGARSVIAVESDDKEATILQYNADRNGWNCTVLREALSLRHLSMPFSYAKVDCENCETILEQLKTIDFPLVVEVHNTATCLR